MMTRWKSVLWLSACCLLAACNLRTTQFSGGTAIPSAAVIETSQPGIGVQTPGATAAASLTGENTPEAGGKPSSSGSGETLDSGSCFDLDAGAVRPAGHRDCDFRFSAVDGETGVNIHFVPMSFSSYAFGSVFWEPPALDSCRSSQLFSTGSLTVAAGQGYYVCYQTGEGRWGWLHLGAYQPPYLLLDWTTYNEQAPLLAEVPVDEPPALSEKIYRQGTNQWVAYFQGLDLDSGVVVSSAGDEGADFWVASGGFDANGAVQSVLLKPANGASFRFGEPLKTLPTPEDCVSASDYSPAVVPVDALRQYICYQTTRGRLGYLYLHEAHPGVGLRLDWITWPEIQPEMAEEPQVAEPESPYRAELVIPEGGLTVPVYPPGRRFSYTWQIANTGGSTWSFLFKLVFADGNLMGAPESQQIRITTEPGEDLKLTLNLAAPDAFGTFTGLYWLEDREGVRFGLGEMGTQPLQVLINVGEPGLTLADGQDVLLETGYCYDLDLGFFAQDDPACDFYLLPAADPALLRFNSPQAAFDFESLMSSPPPLGQCQAARVVSGERLLDLQDWYVCYKTDQGRYGWLYIRESGAGRITFDWRTYQ